MRKALCVVAGALCLTVLAGSAIAAEPAAQRVNAIAKWVPAGSPIFIGWDGSNPAIAKTALSKILQEPEVEDLLKGPLAAMKKLIAAEALKKGELDTDVLLPLLKTKVGLAFVGLAMPEEEGGEPTPEMMLVVEVGKPDSDASRAAALLVDHIIKQAGLDPDDFKKAKIGGVDGWVAQTGEGRMSYATARGHFVFGTGDAVAKAFDQNATKLGDMREFRRVSQVTGGSEVLMVHYAHAAVMQKFGMLIPRDDAWFLTDPEIGLADLRSASLALSPDGKGFRMTFFVRAPGERKGLLKAMAGKPLSPAILKLGPKDTDCFYATSFDAGAFWDFVVANLLREPGDKEDFEEGIAEVNEALGLDFRKDFLGSIGDEFGTFLPGYIAVLKLKDPDAFAASVDKMLHALAAKVSEEERDFRGAQLRLATMTYKGRTITYVDGKRFPLVIQPCYTMVGEYAVIAPYTAMLKSYILRMEGATETFADHPEFKALRAKLGKEPASIYYADSVPFVQQLYSFLPFLVGAMKAAPEEAQDVIPDPAKLPAFATISKHLFGCVAGRRVVRDGIVWESHSPFGLPTPPTIEGAGFIAPAQMGILAGMLLPALGRARGEARKVRDMANLKQIGTAANLWLGKYGEQKYFPPSLRSLWDSGIFDEPKIFVAPGSKTRSRRGEFATDYESILDMLGFSPMEAEAGMDVPLAWDKKGVHTDGRNVVFFDSHVTFYPEHRFQTLMKEEIKPWVAKMKKKFGNKPLPAGRWKEFKFRPMPFGPDAARTPAAQRDMYNLRQIGIAAHIWLGKYGGGTRFPPSLRDLWDKKIIKEPDLLLSPATGRTPTKGKFNTDYECILDSLNREPSEADIGTGADIPLAWNGAGTHKGGRCMVFFDTHLEWVTEEQFRKLKTETIDPWIKKINANK